MNYLINDKLLCGNKGEKVIVLAWEDKVSQRMQHLIEPSELD